MLASVLVFSVPVSVGDLIQSETGEYFFRVKSVRSIPNGLFYNLVIERCDFVEEEGMHVFVKTKVYGEEDCFLFDYCDSFFLL